MKNTKHNAKVLLLDVETAPVLAHVWGLFDQNVGLNQIASDFYILSWSAKWLGDPNSKIIYRDQRNAKNIEDDKAILQELWKLLDECDVTLTQNGRRFDHKKINARFIMHGMQPPSSFKTIDTLVIARKHFAFTSNKLEYMTSKLCKKSKKSHHKKFPGFELWKECLAGNIEAWKEMEAYNKMDIISLEELYNILAPWDAGLNFNLYSDELETTCSCGSSEFKKKGYAYTNNGKYQRFICKKCGANSRGKTNLFDKAKRASLRPKV